MEVARLTRLWEADGEMTSSSARKMSDLPNFCAGGLSGLVLLLALGSLAGCATPVAKEAQFLQKGKSLLENKDYNRSEIEFKNAAQAMPKDAEPYYQLARVYMAQQNVRQASAVLMKATALNPAHAEAQLWLAALMTSSSDKDILGDAEARVRGVLVVKPDDPQALDTLAAAELRLGKIDDAVRHLEQAFTKAPGNEGAALNLARMRAAQHDLVGAEEVLKKLSGDSPKSASAALLLAHFYIGLGKKDEGDAQVHRALLLDPKNASALLLLAALQTEAGTADQAEQTYRVLSALPSNEYKTAHAVHLFRQGKRTQAVNEIETIVRLNPDNRDFRNLLVSAYVQQAQYVEAKNLLAATLKRNPRDADALLQRFAVYFQAGKIEEAEHDLLSVLHFEPTSAMAHFAMGRVYGYKGSRLLQRQELGQAVKLNPNWLLARTELASLLRVDSSPAAALALMDQTPEYQKNTVAYLATRNWVLLSMGRNEEVFKSLSTALASVRTPELLYQDALLKISRKNLTGARQALEEILKTYPESTPVLNALAQSYAAEGQMLKAVEILSERVTQRPKSAPLHGLMGEWLVKAGRDREAREAFGQALNALPNYIPAALALAEMDVATGNLDSARTMLTSVLPSHPENIPGRLLLAQIEDLSGNRSSAVAQYRMVTARDPRNLVALNNLAYALIRDNPNEALKFAQSALEVAPEEPAAQDTYGWICYQKGLYREAVAVLKRAVAKDATAQREYHLGMAYAKVGELLLSKQLVAAALLKDPSLAPRP